MRRGRFFGFILSGPHAGEVLECEHNFYQMVDTGPIIAEFVDYQAEPASTVLETTMYRHQKFSVKNRMYGVWLSDQNTSDDVFTDCVLALIDMDPRQARMCEIRRR